MRLADVSVTYSERGLFSSVEKVKALRGVSLSIARGEKVGVVGANGSGKSTLLRVMSGVLRPDAGVVDHEGMSVALLSLNAGFDAELSGARNIVMHGMLMGLTRREAAARVEPVMRMSGLGDAIHRRVGTYSNGMRGRLCFCTAINLNPDVLLLDEIFSVGDQAFRQTSEQAMMERFRQDKAVVFVSHGVAMMKRVCDRAIWLDGGAIAAAGTVEEVIAGYRGGASRREAEGGAAEAARATS